VHGGKARRSRWVATAELGIQPFAAVYFYLSYFRADLRVSRRPDLHPPTDLREERGALRIHRTLDTRNESRYYYQVIRSFKDRRAEAIFRGEFVKGVDRKIQQRAREKLKYLDAAATLGDLTVPPGNQLEALKGDRKGQHSIRINRQWRVCFVWKDGEALDAEIVDYH
jgi:toxin HigB-1